MAAATILYPNSESLSATTTIVRVEISREALTDQGDNSFYQEERNNTPTRADPKLKEIFDRYRGTSFWSSASVVTLPHL